MTKIGTGRIIASNDVEGALRSIGVAPDFGLDAQGADAEILFVHRRIADGDVYFLTNRKNRAENVRARFRVFGKKPEIWRADTGSAEPACYQIQDGATIVPLEMLPQDSFFVVFRHPGATTETVRAVTWEPAGEIGGPWEVAFQAGRGAPEVTRFEALQSLHTNADPGIKYFSGTAAYRTSFNLPAVANPGTPLMLDLGRVGEVADVRVNGQCVGIAWKAPYRLDIGKAVRAGRNDLEVRVANLWVNRLIGDQQPGARKITFTAVPTYKPDAPLRPSGLMGPVRLLMPR